MIDPTAWHLILTGTLRLPDPANPGALKKVVFQRTGKNYGNLPARGAHGRQQRAHVIPYDPRTPHQRALRARLAAATAAWHALDPATRDAYRDQARNLGHTGFNQWIKEYCASHPIDAAALATHTQQIATTGALRLWGNPANLARENGTICRFNLAHAK